MTQTPDPLAALGRSDRTQLALLATRHPAGARLGRLFERGEVGVVGGLGVGLRFPARALPPGHATQMQAYADALGVIFPGRRIEAALLYTHGPALIALPA